MATYSVAGYCRKWVLPAALRGEDTRAGRTVTIAVETIIFRKPVKVGDVVSCYADLTKIGTTSMTYRIEVWAIRAQSFVREKVTEGVFTYVAIGADGRPRKISSDVEEA